MESAVLTAVSSILTSSIQVVEKTYEVFAVDEQVRGLLQTVDQVAGQLENARMLRRQKSSLFTTFEKGMFEKTFMHTEKALDSVAALAERPRADMEVSGGRLRTSTRVLFVLRESPRIQVSLTRLGIASQNLFSAIMALSGRSAAHTYAHSQHTSVPSLEAKPPPVYAENEFYSAGRLRNLRRRQSASTALSLRGSSEDTTLVRPGTLDHETLSELGELRALADHIPLTPDTSPTSVAGGFNTCPELLRPVIHEVRQPTQRGGRARSQNWLEERFADREEA